jgi:hypothetical protein
MVSTVRPRSHSAATARGTGRAFSAKAHSTSQKQRKRAAAGAAAALPTAASVTALAAREVLSGLPRAQPAEQKQLALKAWLQQEVERALRRAFGGSSKHASPPGGSLLRWWQALGAKRGRQQLDRDVDSLRKAIKDWDETKPSPIVLNAVLTAELKMRTSETVLAWLARVHGRVPSRHLHEQNRTQKAAHGELKQQRDGVDVLVDAFAKGGGKTRDSGYASGMALLQAESKQSVEQTTKTVSGRGEPATRACAMDSPLPRLRWAGASSRGQDPAAGRRRHRAGLVACVDDGAQVQRHPGRT